MTMNPEVLVNEFTPTGSEPPRGMALKPGTVTSATGSDPGDTYVRIDGDTEANPILSLVGAVNSGERVMVLFWPPHGAYIVGRPGTPAGNGAGWQSASPYFGTNWGDFGGGLAPVEFRKEGDWTHLRGVAARSAGVATTIFTLPVGYRINGLQEDFVVLSDTVTYSGLQVLPSGAVVFVPGPGATAAYVSLSGVSFASSDFV